MNDQQGQGRSVTATDDTYFLCHRLSARPLIFFALPNAISTIGIAPLVSPLIPDVPAVFLITLWWTYDEERSVLTIVEQYIP
jgi:hypothetical protein